ncbi:unnamed protein product [Rhizophagus irregularis]|nr:unnamed protein product [Rhizophagus irregularis]
MINYIDYFNNNRSRDPTMLQFIPGGLTSICQPLDVAINKPFKDNLRKEWHLWMANGGAGETTAGNLRRAKYSDVFVGITDSLDSDHEELEISDIDDTS